MSLRGWPSPQVRLSWWSFYGGTRKRLRDALDAVAHRVWPIVRDVGSAMVNAVLVTAGVVIIGLTAASFFR